MAALRPFFIFISMSVIISNSSLTNTIINQPIVINGLVLYYDVANPAVYQSGSSTVNDLSSADLNGSLVNNPTFNENPFYFSGSELPGAP